MILDIGLILNIGLIANIEYKSKDGDSLNRFHNFIKLFKWVYIPYQVIKLHNYVIIPIFQKQVYFIKNEVQSLIIYQCIGNVDVLKLKIDPIYIKDMYLVEYFLNIFLFFDK